MTQAHPVLAGRRVRIRSGRPGDAERLRAILAEPSVSQWWGEPDPLGVIEDELAGDDTGMLLVMEIGGQVAGGIQYSEENDPMYKHAGIDIYLGTRFQGQGAGTEAVALLARYLFSERGHHRITIDPAAHNDRAIRSYAKVGFRPVGVMRQYERGPGGRFHDGLLMDLLRGELAAEIVGGRQYAAAMVNFAVRLVHGPGWDASRPIRSQDGWEEHAAFMDGLVDDGFLILGGPVGDGEPPEQTLHAVEAADEDEVRARLAQDPWARAGLLRIGTIEPWALWLDGRPGQPAP